MGIFNGFGQAPTSRTETLPLGPTPPADDARIFMHVGIQKAPLSIVVYGPGDIARCFAALSALAPVFRTSRLYLDSINSGCFPGQEGIVWHALQSPDGSAVGVHYFLGCDSDFHIRQIDIRLRNLSDPWQFGVCVADSQVPAAFARIFASGAAVPIPLLPGLEQLQADLPNADPEIVGQLLAAGWEEFNGMLRAFVSAEDGEQHAVLFRRVDDQYWVSAPLDDAMNGTVPERFSDMRPDPYRLSIVANVVMLEYALPQPISNVSVEQVRQTAVALAEYALPLRAPLPNPANVTGPSAYLGSALDGDVLLGRSASALSVISVSLHWRLREGTPSDVDIDACAIAVGDRDRVLSDEYFVYYNNLRTPDGSIRHLGHRDERESIDVDLRSLPDAVTAIVFTLSVYDAAERGHSLEAVASAYICVADRDNGTELTRYEIPGCAADATAVVAAELRREQGEWLFRGVGRGYRGGVAAVAEGCGVHV